MIIAGIGSRKTPNNILLEMTKIGEWARQNNHWIRSGHADGADWAFEQGAQERCIVYLPWKGFNRHLKSRARWIVPEITYSHVNLTNIHHPKPEALSDGAFRMMARNVCQVLGEKLESYSDIVVCWTPDWKKPSGGTSQAIRIADSRGIPVLNMSAPGLGTAEEVIYAIEQTFKIVGT